MTSASNVVPTSFTSAAGMSGSSPRSSAPAIRSDICRSASSRAESLPRVASWAGSPDSAARRANSATRGYVDRNRSGPDRSNERSGPERFLSTYPLVAEFARRAAESGDPAQLATLGRLSARLLALRQMSLRIAGALDRGELPDIPAALVKDVGTTFEADVIDEVRRVVDVPASLDSPDPLGRALAEAQLHAPGYTLRGGTNEILRGIVARGLGLR